MSVLLPEMDHVPAAELLTDLMLPGIVTDVVLQKAHILHTLNTMFLRVCYHRQLLSY